MCAVILTIIFLGSPPVTIENTFSTCEGANAAAESTQVWVPEGGSAWQYVKELSTPPVSSGNGSGG